MLASTIALHEGYVFNPDSASYWKQSKNGENAFLYVTTQHITKQHVLSMLEELNSESSLLIVCKSFDSELNVGLRNITIKKIPSSILKNCEFDADDYNLNISKKEPNEDLLEADELYE